MARNHQWNDSILTYNLPGGPVIVNLLDLPETIIQKAVQFALPTLLRNATAGLLNEDPAKAEERVKARIAAWLAGNWSAKGEASAEPRTSILARAVAEALGIDVGTAAGKIEAAVEAALEKAGLDAEAEDDDEKAKVKAMANAVRKLFREAVEVAPIYKTMRDDAAAKAAAEKPAVSLASLIG